ncbi:CaiB/BaiF CoA transferase family protein [Mycobacterium paraintracellulare]|uniref:CaiB/BaiF CoA transferase family protein n=1 Tax=Mycobacterium paraintracellulare TaxID=1138383 RepID=UPI001925BE0A|nr:CaiB/BaiF CoA-transferase family protein [Mycobacterium paraintracellulare]BCP14239.1 CoA transferase [Mycobacterium paraintracellulare]
MNNEALDQLTPPAGRGGPLNGIRVVELAGIGPGPYAAMLLADMGADVVRVERPGPPSTGLSAQHDVLQRNRPSVILDIKRPEGVCTVLNMVARADVLIEGYRPGVTERLGLGPEDCWDVNPRLVYGRITGWGQQGPLARSAGHDINYIAITGALHAIGRKGGPPVPPVNLLGDFAGGSAFLVIGVLAALLEASRSGLGQVVDAAIVDGASSLTSLLHGMMSAGQWRDDRGHNMFDTGRPWYDVYQTADGQWMAVGALEPKFYAEMMRLLGMEADHDERSDPSRWPALRERLAATFASKTRNEWSELFDGTDACVAPVYSMTEAPMNKHLQTRGTFTVTGDVVQPAPAPRFSRTPNPAPRMLPNAGVDVRRVLTDWGVDDIDALIESGSAVECTD